MNYNSENHAQIVEFLEYIKEIRKYSEHTIRNYRIDLTQFAEYLYKCNHELLIIDVQNQL